VASTLTLSVRHRGGEVALLRALGATPRQVRRLVVGEAMVLAVLALAAAVAPSVLAGRVVLALVEDSGQVSASVDHAFGRMALGTGAVVTVVGGAVAAWIAARRAAGLTARDALTAAAADSGRVGRGRTVAAVLFMLLGLDLAVVTATVFHGEGVDAMQTAGQACIWFAIGLALLAPALVRAGTRLVGGALARWGGAVGELARINLAQRSRAMGRALVPIVLFTTIATGTLTMQTVENRATAAAGVQPTVDAQAIETLNLVVVGMIALFAAIMLVNTLAAVTAERRAELGRQRLAGATPRQVLGMVAVESATLAAIGVAAGSVASLVTILPFSYARTDTPVPDASWLAYVGVVVLAAALTLGTAVAAAGRALRTPAVAAAVPIT
jgi:FtsX-like permease family